MDLSPKLGQKGIGPLLAPLQECMACWLPQPACLSIVDCIFVNVTLKIISNWRNQDVS